MRKELPINIKSPITTECWTFYRMAILSSYPNFKPWFIDHYNNIFMTKEYYNLFYGENRTIYNQTSVYNDVIRTTAYPISYVNTQNKVIKAIKEMLDKDCYVIIECKDHEVFVYGYDDNGSFMSVEMNNGVWYKKEYSFEFVADSFLKMRLIDKSKKFTRMYAKVREYHYPFTIIKVLETQYTPDIYKLQIRMQESFYNYKTYKISITDNSENLKYWDGPYSVFDGFYEIMTQIINDEIDWDYRIAIKLKKLTEYNRLFRQKMVWLMEYYNVDFSDKMFDAYDKVIKDLDINFNLAIRYNIDSNKENIKKIHDRLCQNSFEFNLAYTDFLIKIQDLIIERLD